MSQQSYRIFIEPAYQVLNNQFSISLSYRIHPYHPESWAKEHLAVDDYKAYQDRRERFKAHCKKTSLQRFKVCGRSNQIGRYELDIASDISLSEFRQQFYHAVESLAGMVDGFDGV